MATVAYAVFGPVLERMHISSAGHLPPVLAVPGQPAELAGVRPNPMIGMVPAARRHVTAV